MVKRSAGLMLAAVLGCRGTEPGVVQPGSVLWMEWPAEVVANQPYQVRVVIPPLCSDGDLVFRQVPNDSAIVFDAKWVNVRPSHWGCEPAGPIYSVSTRDASAIAGAPRPLEVLGNSHDGSQRRFGALAIVASRRDTTIFAAGPATLLAGRPGCVYIVPGGYSPNSDRYQLEGSTSGLSDWPPAWVEGRITRGATPCTSWSGDTLIFLRSAQ